MAHDPHTHEDTAPKHHPNYVLIAAWLAIVTLLEVGVAVVKIPLLPVVPVLIIMAVFKASLVVLYFMHLRFDSRLFVIIFLVPLFFGVMFITGVLFAPPQ